MSEDAFRKTWNELTQTENEKQLKYKTNILLNNSCLYSYQVKDIATLYVDEHSRLEFAMAAYSKTVDPENYYDVYDSFALFSIAFKLHDFVLAQRAGTPNAVMEPIRPVKLQFPAYKYPDANGYSGSKSCYPPTGDMEFEKVAQNVMQQTSDAERLTLCIHQAKEHCFTTAQIMKLTSLIGDENSRLKFLYDAFFYAHDADNYGACEQTLTPGKNRDEFARFLADRKQFEPTPPPPPCSVSAIELEQIKASIKNQSLNKTQVTLAKQALSSKPCFTSLQIREIVSLFSFESSKLEIAKYAYDFCEDKSKYFFVNDAFSFSSSVDELNKYIQSK